MSPTPSPAHEWMEFWSNGVRFRRGRQRCWQAWQQIDGHWPVFQLVSDAGACLASVTKVDRREWYARVHGFDVYIRNDRRRGAIWEPGLSFGQLKLAKAFCETTLQRVEQCIYG